jgi:hypothetical protein
VGRATKQTSRDSSVFFSIQAPFRRFQSSMRCQFKYFLLEAVPKLQFLEQLPLKTAVL